MWVANACSFSKLLWVMIWYKRNSLWFCSKRNWTSGDFILKNAKIQSSQWSWIPTKETWHDIQNSNPSHMLLVWALSFVKLLWPLLRFSSCTHDQDSHIPINKMLTPTLRVTQKHAFFVHQNNYSIHLSCVLVKKFHMPKRIVWAMLKKGRKR